MNELRLSEHFVSPQGEGPRTGTLTQFVRFAGCNMRCPGWPCDTQYAIDPKIWVHDSFKATPLELARECIEQRKLTGANWINLTGGEPFLQPHELLEKFINYLLPKAFWFESFSNGSFEYPIWAIDNIHFIMDWKLGGSGEKNTMRDVRMRNIQRLKSKDSVKFVVTNWEDFSEAMQVWARMQDLPVEWWVGPAWGKIEPAQLVEWVKEFKLPWRLNVQVHNYIYEPQERGR